jgi:hypothetical protein
LLKVLGVSGREEGALVMIEPPGDLGRTGVLEIDDSILVAVELLLVEKRARTMDQAGEDEFGVLANALAIKTREQRGGGSSVKAFVVIEDPYSQMNSPIAQQISRRRNTARMARDCDAGKS